MLFAQMRAGSKNPYPDSAEITTILVELPKDFTIPWPDNF
jgi:hypothetical protein